MKEVITATVRCGRAARDVTPSRSAGLKHAMDAYTSITRRRR